MKMPDKIYVHTGPHLGMLNLTIIPVNAPDEEIYIRKDALLEWAKENQKDAGPFTTACYQVFVDKLNEM